jgi:acyl-CoA reductase-like NAD-dependent aldehyde dehydrogenase
MLLELHVPTLRTNVEPDDQIAHEASFGPVPAVSGCGDDDALSGMTTRSAAETTAAPSKASNRPAWAG